LKHIGIYQLFKYIKVIILFSFYFAGYFSSSEAAMARQAKLHAASSSSSSQAPKPTESKPTQLQNAVAVIQGGLVSIIMVQSIIN
jgi:hypothetical protein